MRHPAAFLALLTGLVALPTACVPARIVESEGRRVTFAWDPRRTRLARVYELAIGYCHRWNAPPEFVANEILEDGRRRTTFACRPRPTLPLDRIL